MTKDILIGLSLFGLGLAGGRAQTVRVEFSTLNLAGIPAARSITVTPLPGTLLQTDGTNVITGGSLVLPASPHPVVTNLWVGGYSVTIQGVPRSWAIQVSTNFGPGPVPAVWFSTNLVWSGTPFAQGVSQLVAGTNITLTPGDGLGRVLIAGVAGVVTNGETNVSLGGAFTGAFTGDGSRVTNAASLADSPYLTWYNGAVAVQSGTDPASVWVTGELQAGVAGGGVAGSWSNGVLSTAGPVRAAGFYGSGAGLTNVSAAYATVAGSAGFASAAGSAGSVAWSALPGPVLTNTQSGVAFGGLLNASNLFQVGSAIAPALAVATNGRVVFSGTVFDPGGAINAFAVNSTFFTSDGQITIAGGATGATFGNGSLVIDPAGDLTLATGVVSGNGAGLTNVPWSPTHAALLAAAAGGEYQMVSVRYNQNLTPTNALVLWPDGTYGVWQATNLNALWLTADGYTLTYTNTGELIAQATISRDQNGNVTNAPPLGIWP